MTNPNAYTVFVGNGRVCTCTTREQAERIRDMIIRDPAKWLHIREWIPGEHYPFVTFDGDSVEEKYGS